MYAITKQSDISVMLLIWRHDLESPGTTKHLLDVLIHATGYLNPGQAAVIGFDHPLYAIAKKLQWYHPDLYGPAKLVPMLGTLTQRCSCFVAWETGCKTVVGK